MCFKETSNLHSPCACTFTTKFPSQLLSSVDSGKNKSTTSRHFKNVFYGRPFVRLLTQINFNHVNWYKILGVFYEHLWTLHLLSPKLQFLL